MNTNLSTFPWGHGALTAAEWAKNFRDELRVMIDDNECKAIEVHQELSEKNSDYWYWFGYYQAFCKIEKEILDE